MTSAPAIIHSPEEQWQLRRRELVTASDAAAILGADERRGELAVWASKVGDADTDETVPMRRGKRHEAAIILDYAEETGRAARPWPAFEIIQHPLVPFVGATLDATTCIEAERWFPLEVKLAVGSAADWKDEPPLYYEIQAQIQAQCFVSELAALAGLIGPGPLKTYDLPRDDAFFAAAVPKFERFMWHVRKRIPPEADGKPGTSAAIRRLWGAEDGTTVALDAEATKLVQQWNQAKDRLSATKDTAETLENQLRARLGSASFGALTDGSFLALPVTKRAGYSVKPTSYRVLRHKRPRLQKRG